MAGSDLPELGALRRAPATGVAQVIVDAIKLGYAPGHPDWSNLGPAHPEAGPIEGDSERLAEMPIEVDDYAYAPPGGLPLLRERIAEWVNRTARQGKTSQYGPENVVVGPGVRPSLGRALASLDAVPIGYVCPDCAYFEDLLEPHVGRTTPVVLRTDPSDGFQLRLDAVERTVRDAGLGALLLSNPNNPSGTVVAGKRLERLVGMSREQHCTLLIDEAYAPYALSKEGELMEAPLAAAAYVEDVERDPVLIFDGLSMRHRAPGWRVGWAIGPSAMVAELARTGAALDGGASRLAQAAASAVLDGDRLDAELTATATHFAKKRALAVKRLTELGLKVLDTSRTSFFVWADLSELPEPFDESLALYKRCLQNRVITVPGEAFDVDPGRRRRGDSPYHSWMRFSLGPSLDNLRMGLDRLSKAIREA
ncbi:MAG: pyridoxal phosphate-dependent aminotransferase [Planctomycetota bacterium]